LQIVDDILLVLRLQDGLESFHGAAYIPGCCCRSLLPVAAANYCEKNPLDLSKFLIQKAMNNWLPDGVFFDFSTSLVCSSASCSSGGCCCNLLLLRTLVES